MEHKCHDITLTFLNEGESVCREIDFHVDVPHEIKSYIDTETLLGFAAVYGDDEWAIDVSCEGKSSYIVIIEIATGITYTFLNQTCLSITNHPIMFSYVQIWTNLSRTKKTERH